MKNEHIQTQAQTTFAHFYTDGKLYFSADETVPWRYSWQKVKTGFKKTKFHNVKTLKWQI